MLDRLRRQGDDGVAHRHDRRGRGPDEAGDQFGDPQRDRGGQQTGQRAEHAPQAAPRALGSGARGGAGTWTEVVTPCLRARSRIRIHSRDSRARPATCRLRPRSARLAVPTRRAAADPVAGRCRRPCGSPRSRWACSPPSCSSTRGCSGTASTPRSTADRGRSGRHHRGRRPPLRAARPVPYLVLGLVLALAAWFLPRRQPWARWIGLAAQLRCSRC